MPSEVTKPSEAPKKKTSAEWIAKLIQEHPELKVEDEIHLPLWPVYVYGQSKVADELWELIAQRVGVDFYKRTDDFAYLKQPLNKDIDKAIADGILWYQLHGEGTRNQLIGITYQAAVAGPHIHLVPPELWFKILGYLYPFEQTYKMDASNYLATYTTEADDPDFGAMTSIQRRASLRYREGVESGVPLEVAISQEAFVLAGSGVAGVQWMRRYHVIPYQIQEGEIKAFTTALDSEGLDMLRRATRMTIIPVYMDEEDEAAFWQNYDKVEAAEDEEV